MCRRASWRLACVLGGVAVLAAAVPAAAQTAGRSGTGISGTSGSGLTGGGAGGSGFTGGSSGSGFTGSGMSTFSGSSGSSTFSGTSGSSYRGTGTGGVTGTSQFPQVPSQQNPFAQTYVNPLQLGQKITTTTDLLGTSTTTSSTAFGQPTLGTQQGTNVTARPGGASSASATAGTGGFTTVGVMRSPTFVTELGAPPPRPVPTVMAANVAGRLARSSALTSRDAIRVGVSPDGEVVTLDGWVATPYERRMAELLARMTPFVHEVRNRLQVGAPPAVTARR